MTKVKAYVTYGLGSGCHEEVADAFIKAGADSEIVHIKQLLKGDKDLSESQILNLSGGFLHGDILGAGMCAADEIEHVITKKNDEEKKFKDLLLEYAAKGNIIYGQCNGFQVLVKTGLLPGIDGDYSKQTVTLTNNDCGNYRVAWVPHSVDKHYKNHFAFQGIDELYLWCRHGEGKLVFYSDYGLITKEEGEKNRKKVNESHVLLRYINPIYNAPTEKFPYNPNGSVDGIAGLVNAEGNIFAHMGHTEVGIYRSRNPDFFKWKDMLRRQGIKAEDITPEMLEDACLKIFKNIVNYFK